MVNTLPFIFKPNKHHFVFHFYANIDVSSIKQFNMLFYDVCVVSLLAIMVDK